MRVAVNGLFLTRPTSGVGQYTRNLLLHLPKQLPSSEIVVFVPEPLDLKLPAPVSLEVVRPRRGYLGRGMALDHWERKAVPAAALAAEADLYHTPYPTPSPNVAIPRLMTVHDVIPWQLPFYRRALRSRMKLRKTMAGIQDADHILSVSESAADDIVDVARVARDRISVTYEGLDPAFAKRPAASEVTKAKQTHGLERPYVFYIGGFDFRKNVRGLIAAFGHSGLAETHDLVIAGTASVPGRALYADYHRLSILLAQAGIGSQTRLIGRISEAEKAALLCGAAAFCYPSLAEGFGLPVLEALAVGTPVATSHLPVIQELFAGAVNAFDPYDAADIANVLRQTVDSPSDAYRRRGWAIATRELTWEKAAKRTAVAYREAVGK